MNFIITSSYMYTMYFNCSYCNHLFLIPAIPSSSLSLPKSVPLLFPSSFSPTEFYSYCLQEHDNGLLTLLYAIHSRKSSLPSP